MDIKGEKLEVMPLKRDEKGDKVEPEQVPARRLLDVSDTISLGSPGSEVKSRHQMPINVSIEMPAVELATGISQACFMCKNFDQKAWRQYMRKAASTVDGQRELNQMRAAIAGSSNAAVHARHANGSDGDTDVEHAMQMLGICHPLTELMKTPQIVYPISTCPATTRTGIPFENSFSPRTRDDERQSSASFDSIMRAAQGK